MDRLDFVCLGYALAITTFDTAAHGAGLASALTMQEMPRAPLIYGTPMYEAFWMGAYATVSAALGTVIGRNYRNT